MSEPQAPADLFASQPLPASGYVQAGAQHNLAMAIPTYDSPWVERDGPYYQQLLTGVAPFNDGAGTTAVVPGFDPLLAFAMAFTALAPKLDWLRRHQRLIQRIGGVVMILVGVAMVTGLWDRLMDVLRQWAASFGTIL